MSVTLPDSTSLATTFPKIPFSAVMIDRAESILCRKRALIVDLRIYLTKDHPVLFGMNFELPGSISGRD